MSQTHPLQATRDGRAAVTGRWLATLQRLAGNDAVAGLLRPRSSVQRDAPIGESPIAGGGAGADTAVESSREPTKQERAEWGAYFDDADFRIVRPPEVGYNCFAWAVGAIDRMLTSDTLMQANYTPDLDGWSKYLADKYRFAPTGDGLDASADLILYGQTPTSIWHAARKADAPFGRLTFSSKLGDGRSPVILHAPADIQGRNYGAAQRSFRRA